MREEALRFIEGQLRRAKINLEMAEGRKDTKAVTNIQRKIRLYLYIIKVLSEVREDES